jgi:hypothetical protein
MQKGALKGAPFTIQMERAMRFELTTLTLARLCSTPELRPHRLDGGQISEVAGGCKGKNAQAPGFMPRRFQGRAAAAASMIAVAM